MTFPKPYEGLVSERVGDELVLVDPGANESFARNPTGACFLKPTAGLASNRRLPSSR
jgi:hypothetical protein